MDIHLAEQKQLLTLTLPMLKPQPGSAGSILPTSLPKLPARILLAEDGPESQRLISFVLRKVGLEVDIVADGQEAVQKVLQSMEPGTEAAPYDLILMDMLMPKMDGFEATRRLRQLGYRGPIIALTALTQTYLRSQCLEAGCDEYLPKPLDRETLLIMVCKYLDATFSTASSRLGTRRSASA